MQRVALTLHHPLGFAGRTGGVDDVGERVRRNINIGIAIRPRRQGVDIDHARFVRRKSLRHLQIARIGDHDGGLGIFDDVGVAAFRKSWVNRNVSLPSLKHAQDGGDAR
jgi:hypothetical protein